MLYPYNSPIILTDALFTLYGGITGSSTQAVRNAAYQIAEQFVSDDLDSFLLPTTVTGTYSYGSTITLDHTYVNRVDIIRFYDHEEDLYFTVSGTANIYASLRNNGEYGMLDLHGLISNCGGCQPYPGMYPYKVQVVYNAGFSSGTSFQPKILLALSMMAGIMVNEIVGFGNESPGDVGVQRFSNQDYSETRVALIRTVYGTSSKAQLIHKLLSSYRLYRYVGL